MGAEEFLEQVGSNKSSVLRLNIKAFEEKQADEGKPLKLPEDYLKIPDVVLPPSDLEMNVKNGDGSEFKETEILSRTKLLSELFSEMNLAYFVVEGTNTPNMIRKLSYLAFILPSIDKMVFVNDEEGNATYVIHEGVNERWKEYIKMSKEELRELPFELVSFLNYPDKNIDNREILWKERIKEILTSNDRKLKKPEEKFNEFEFVPKGWRTKHFASKIINTGEQTFSKYANEFREDHPEWFRFFKNKQGKVYEYCSPELIDKIKEKIDEIEIAPEGWETRYSAGKIIKTTGETFEKYANEFRKEHPEWFGIFKDTLRRPFEHYSPELVEKIRKKINDFKIAPEEWKTMSSAGKIINTGRQTFSKYANEFREDHPEWFRFFKNKQGKVYEYCSPELIDKIKEKIDEIEIAPEGWETKKSAGEIVNIDGQTFEKYAKNFKEKHPEWFKIFKNKQGISFKYYSPELVEEIRKKELLKKIKSL